MIPLTLVTKTLTGLVAKTRVHLQDWAGERFERERVIQALNDAAVVLSVEQGLCMDEVVIRMFEGVVSYDVLLSVNAARLSGSGIRRFEGIERVVFDGADVVRAGGADEFFKVKGLRWTSDFSEWGGLSLFSPPSVTGDETGTGGNLTVMYRGLPEPMVDDADRPDSGLPVCDEALCLSAASELLLEGSLEDFARGLELGRLARIEMGRVRGALNNKGYVMEMMPL